MTVSAERLARVFVEVADTLVDEFDMIEFLQMLADRAAGLINAAAVGLMLADQRGRLEFVAASAESVRLIELFQIQNAEGPCVDAFRSGELVVNVDLRQAATRWPRFGPHATAAGFRSVHAFPMRLRSEVIGALNVFSDQIGRLNEADVEIVQAVTDVAVIGLLQERAIHRGEALTEQLQLALNSRIIIEQAKGVIAQSQGVSVDVAFSMLRQHARSHNRRLGDLASAIVTNRASVPELGVVRPVAEGGDRSDPRAHQ